jgi:hypothetical protein
MRVTNIVKRGWWPWGKDTVTLHAEELIVIQKIVQPNMYAGTSFEKDFSEYQISKGTTMTVQMPQRFNLQVDDTVSDTLLFRLYSERFTRIM